MVKGVSQGAVCLAEYNRKIHLSPHPDYDFSDTIFDDVCCATVGPLDFLLARGRCLGGSAHDSELDNAGFGHGGL